MRLIFKIFMNIFGKEEFKRRNEVAKGGPVMDNP